MTPSITPVIPTSAAFKMFADSLEKEDKGANDKTNNEVFLFLVDKITREYPQFDFNTFVYHAKPHAIPLEVLADYFTRWIAAMSALNKIIRIPALVFDHESYVLV